MFSSNFYFNCLGTFSNVFLSLAREARSILIYVLQCIRFAVQASDDPADSCPITPSSSLRYIACTVHWIAPTIQGGPVGSIGSQAAVLANVFEVAVDG